MRSFARLTVLAVALGSAFASQALASDPSFNYHRPVVVLGNLIKALPAVNLGAIPVAGTEGNAENQAFTVVRDGQQVGTIQYTANAVENSATLIVTSALGRELAVYEETAFPCKWKYAAGLCRRVTLSNALQPEMDGSPAFMITDYPYGGLEHWRYDEETNVIVWRNAWDEAFQWILDVMVKSPEGQTIVFATPVDRLSYVLSADPILAPWLGGLKFSTVGDRLIVTGQLPSTAVYSLLVQNLLAAGYTNFSDQILINSFLYGAPDYQPVPPPLPY